MRLFTGNVLETVGHVFVRLRPVTDPGYAQLQMPDRPDFREAHAQRGGARGGSLWRIGM